MAEFERYLPPLDILDETPPTKRTQSLTEDSLAQKARWLETVLSDFGVQGRIIKVRPGPVVTLYELEPAPGTQSSHVVGLADDIARSMCATSVRVAVIPGRNVIGIEMPNAHRETVYLRELLESEAYESTAWKLTLVLGKDTGGAPMMVDLARMPHLLIAGTTGSGKSVAINTMILSLLYRLPPDQCKFIMIDPKMLELSVYDNIPHLLTPVVTEPGKAVVALEWVVREMRRRYGAMSQLGVRNIAGFNARLTEANAKGEALSRIVQTGFDPETGKPVFEDVPLATDPLPYIVVVVDEMADLMRTAGTEIEAAAQHFAQMGQAAGIHLIMATNDMAGDVITSSIRASFPTRATFQIVTPTDGVSIFSGTDAGFVYAMINPSMPNLVKVGKTTRNPIERAKELSGSTGVPTPFIVVYYDFFSNCSQAESFVHLKLEQEGFRVSGNREFFTAEVAGVIRAIAACPGKMASGSTEDTTQLLAAARYAGEHSAQQLLGQGDMLYMAGDGRITRIQGPFVSDQEVEDVVRFLKNQGPPASNVGITEDMLAWEDEFYNQAVALVCRERKVSNIFVQRHLQIGYNRAAQIIEQMEKEGVVGPANHVGKREVLPRSIDEEPNQTDGSPVALAIEHFDAPQLSLAASIAAVIAAFSLVILFGLYG